MDRIRYEIVSKLKDRKGEPLFRKYGVTTDFEKARSYHLFHFQHLTHPDPQLREWIFVHGVNSLEIIRLTKPNPKKRTSGSAV